MRAHPQVTGFRNHPIRYLAARTMLLSVVLLAVAVVPAMILAAEPAATDDATIGSELFRREWLPNDSRSHGGDGLGPVFNDSSCVACHNQGGTGGGGPASKNVDIVSAVASPVQAVEQRGILQTVVGAFVGRKPVEPPRPPSDQQKQALRDELTRLHPGFRTARSVVLHRSGTIDGYDKWRGALRGEMSESFFEEQPVAVAGAAIFPVSAVRAAPIEDRPEPVAVAEQDEGNFGTSADLLAQAMHVRSVSFVEQLPPSFVFRSMIAELLMSFAQVIAEPNQGIDLSVAAVAEAPVGAFPIGIDFDFAGGSASFQQVGNFLILGSQRNTTALFGVGVIDSIPDAVLEAASKSRFPEFPHVSGRVSRLKDGKIGRFGWKAQKATLRDFTMTACAVELGLNVPEHDQAGIPAQPDYKPAGYDLNQRQCDGLVTFLRQLPAPAETQPPAPRETAYLEAGKELFTQVGCATCHTPKLGDVEGLYSDLLLHDMGQSLADNGSYGVFVPNSDEGNEDEMLVFAETLQSPPKKLTREQQEQDDAKAIGARNLEWRTPPLWGVRDSSPYLHDGRAATLEGAIALHDGEARESRYRFSQLSSAERLKLVSFLKSLTAR